MVAKSIQSQCFDRIDQFEIDLYMYYALGGVYEVCENYVYEKVMQNECLRMKAHGESQ